MLQLKSCKFTGLPASEELVVDLSKVTTLTGPNGTGKSTVLKTIDFAFRILENREVCDNLPLHDEWYLFETATLEFESTTLLKTSLLGEFTSFEVLIDCDSTSYFISGVAADERSVAVTKPILQSHLEEWAGIVNAARKQLAGYTEELERAPTHQHHTLVEQQRAGRNSATEKVGEFEKLLSENQLISLDFQEAENSTQLNLSRLDFNEFLQALNIPTVRLITTQGLMEQDIPALIAQLVALKKGGKVDAKKFKQIEQRLSQLLQSEIDVSETKEHGQSMLINGIPYQKASMGTYLTLSFFALTESDDLNRVVLWDEPENGLHPTRRNQLLELMYLDGRQFVIATHATEFAPVLQSECKVYRCVSDYDEPSSNLQFLLMPVATRRDAFETLDALGIHPARTLFTANVVIWIEGPTELLFYRHWLSRRLEKQGYQEGLHYSFMQYGGSLINYLGVADDLHLTSTIDLLSHGRHAIVLVDSDLKEEPPIAQRRILPKEGARRISDQIDMVNLRRKDAAMFQATRGREIENYLPKAAVWHAIEVLWSDFLNHKDALPLDQIDLGPFRKYPEALDEFFQAHGIVDEHKLPKGRSHWGATNKVAMMRAALTLPEFEEKMLELNCSEELLKIESFIRSKHQFHYPVGIA